MTTTTQEKLLYTGRTHTTGGREGESRTPDGRLAVKLSVPGTSGSGTNPEQLFAAGWSACFEGAMAGVARQMNFKLPHDLAVDAEVDLWNGDDGYYLKGRLNVSLPGVPRETAQAIVDAASNTCPYSKAIKGNVDTKYTVV